MKRAVQPLLRARGVGQVFWHLQEPRREGAAVVTTHDPRRER